MEAQSSKCIISPKKEKRGSFKRKKAQKYPPSARASGGALRGPSRQGFRLDRLRWCELTVVVMRPTMVACVSMTVFVRVPMPVTMGATLLISMLQDNQVSPLPRIAKPLIPGLGIQSSELLLA